MPDGVDRAVELYRNARRGADVPFGTLRGVTSIPMEPTPLVAYTDGLQARFELGSPSLCCGDTGQLGSGPVSHQLEGRLPPSDRSSG